MKFYPNSKTSIEEVATVLQSNMPQYKTELKKNPLLGFQFVQVSRSSFVGAWVRIKNDNAITVNGATPSALARGLLGRFFIFTYFARKKVEREVAMVLQQKLNKN